MSDLQLPDRLTQLRSRWEADPASRIFLQLAEEYRHLGRLHEALSVLETGLKEHPGYLSALVAKGRCLLELGNPEPAREVLERVVRQDATQAVANKLLVRAYLETGQGERAKERLDLYSLLHDGDPEIEELRGRIRRLDGSGRGEGKTAAPAAAPTSPPAPPPDLEGDDLFSLPPPPGRPAAASPATPATPVRPAARVAPEEGEVFQLDQPLSRRPAAQAVQDVFELDYPAVAAIQALPETALAGITEPAAAAAQVKPAPAQVQPAPAPLLPRDDEPEPTPEGEPFPGLVSRAVRQRYLAGLGAEGLFPAGPAPVPVPRAVPAPPPPPPEVAPVAAAAPAVAAPVLAAPPAPAPPVDVAPGEIFPLRSIGEAVEAELRRSAEPAAVPAPEPALPEPVTEPEPAALAPAAASPIEDKEAAEDNEAATVTLGDLYLRQGHLDEAEGIFREVLRREPANAAAQAGLARITESRAPVPPAPPVEIAEIGDIAAMAAPADRRSRKILMLNSYLQRIRRGSHPDVP